MAKSSHQKGQIKIDN